MSALFECCATWPRIQGLTPTGARNGEGRLGEGRPSRVQRIESGATKAASFPKSPPLLPQGIGRRRATGAQSVVLVGQFHLSPRTSTSVQDRLDTTLALSTAELHAAP